MTYLPAYIELFRKEVNSMRGINKVILIGYATRDAELHPMKSGQLMANIRMATNRGVRTPDGLEREDTQYHTVICFNRLAEMAGKYITKGKLLYVEGRLETRKFTDKEGRERELPDIVAQAVQFLSSNRGGESEGTDATVDDGKLDEIPL
jgi:single-strand DNA-binding protein